MTFEYRVFFTRADPGGELAAEIVTDYPLDSALGRIAAEKVLAGRGVHGPKIVGWALHRAADQEK